MSDQFIGLDVGGTKIAVGDARGRRAVETRELITTEPATQDELVEQLVGAIERARAPTTRRGRRSACRRSSSSRPGRIAPQRQHPARTTCRCASC